MSLEFPVQQAVGSWITEQYPPQKLFTAYINAERVLTSVIKPVVVYCVLSAWSAFLIPPRGNALMRKKQLSNNCHTSSGYFILSISSSLMFPEPWGLISRCMIVFFHLLIRIGTLCHNHHNNHNVLFSQFS